MIKLYSGAHALETHHVRNLLEQAGIRAVVMGDALAITRGETPWGPETLPAIWIEEADAEEALRIVRQHEDSGLRRIDVAPLPDWACPACGETVDGEFGECWNCRTPQVATDEGKT